MSKPPGSKPKKIQTRTALKQIAARLKKSGEVIVFTNGCFDILHAGHVTYLEKAKQLGDILVVGVNSDSSVKRLKGPDRPVNSERDRLKIISALGAVDYAVLFSEDTPLELICRVRPDILVKGADWKKDQIAGAEEVESWGGKVKQIPLVPGRSTTRVLKKIEGRHCEEPRRSRRRNNLRAHILFRPASRDSQ